jgi:ribosomal protein L27
VKKGVDDTLYAATDGIVKFSSRKKPSFTGRLRQIKSVNVIPSK